MAKSSTEIIIDPIGNKMTPSCSWNNAQVHFPVPPPHCRQQYYNLAKTYPSDERKYLCDVCNKSFYSKNQLKKHIDGHVECPFPNCNLSADMKVIDQHINHQHLLVNYDSIQVDDEAWISERKRRFPSKQRAELRRAQQIERLSRGERLGMNSKKIKSLPSKNNSFSPNNVTKRPMRKPSERAPKSKPNPITVFDVDLYDSDPDVKTDIPAFKGTRCFYESTGELNILGTKLSPVEEDTETDPSAMLISDDENEEWQGKVDQPSDKLSLSNALGSLIGAYATDSEEDPPEIVPLKDGTPDMNGNKEVQNYKRKRNAHGQNKRAKDSSYLKKRHPILKKYRRPSLLERLLNSEIRHERNVILQCVRHVVSNNFFSNDSS